VTFYFYSTKDMNIKKMFTVLSGVIVEATMVMPSASVLGASYSQELQDAYNWAHDKGITTMSTIDNANMYGAITRAEMAKMLSVYATKVLGKTADTSKTLDLQIQIQLIVNLEVTLLNLVN
jgi:predicted transcriptional regulator